MQSIFRQLHRSHHKVGGNFFPFFNLKLKHLKSHTWWGVCNLCHRCSHFLDFAFTFPSGVGDCLIYFPSKSLSTSSLRAKFSLAAARIADRSPPWWVLVSIRPCEPSQTGLTKSNTYSTRGRGKKASSQAPSGLERHGGSIPPIWTCSDRIWVTVGPTSWWSGWMLNRHRNDVGALKA